MANKNGNGKGKRYRPLKYLFLNGELMRVLFISRPRDEIELWSYPSEKRAVYNYTDVKKRMEKAFTTTEVAKMLNRHPMTIHKYLWSGEIEQPQFIYGLTEVRQRFAYMWSEKDIMALHAVLASKHAGGGPRKNNDERNNTPKHLPNARELRAMIRHDTVFYVKTDDGFVPTWKAE